MFFKDLTNTLSVKELSVHIISTNLIENNKQKEDIQNCIYMHIRNATKRMFKGTKSHFSYNSLHCLCTKYNL